MNSGTLAKLIIFAGILLLPIAQVSAATITVGATCTFKQAWDSAFDDSAPTGSGCTAGSGNDIIELQADVVLGAKVWEGSSGTGTLTINGNGHAIRGDGTYAFFGIWGAPTITFNNITFTGAAGGDRENGAVLNPYSGAGTYTFNDCVFHNNEALKRVGNSGGLGGAISAGPQTTITINRCAFYNNRAGWRGGAIYTSGNLNINNSSFFNNRSDVSGGALFIGVTSSKTLRFRHVTITRNTSGEANSGALEFQSARYAHLLNSIVYGNTPGDCYRINTELIRSLGANTGNIIGISNCDFINGVGTVNKAATDDPRLAGPFGTYYIPRAGSPAINAVSCLAANVGGNIDQRGNARPIETQCDRGSIEHAGYVPPPPPPPDSDVGGPGGGSASRSGSQAEGMPTAVPVIRYSPAQSCQTLQPDIVVSKASSGTSCSRVEGSEIGHPDVIAAMPSLVVDLWGWVTPNTQVCFRASSGSIKFIDTTAIPRAVADLPVFSEEGGLLCATIDGAGQVALVAGPSAPASAPQQQAASTQGTMLSGCMVTLQYSLNFRDAPDGEKIGALRSQIKLTALERTDGWFKVDYHGERGWISAAYVEPEGDCG